LCDYAKISLGRVLLTVLQTISMHRRLDGNGMQETAQKTCRKNPVQAFLGLTGLVLTCLLIKNGTARSVFWYLRPGIPKRLQQKKDFLSASCRKALTKIRRSTPATKGLLTQTMKFCRATPIRKIAIVVARHEFCFSCT
jgi:hypothetical protein